MQTAWRGAGIQPAPLCCDEVFIRRVYLDVIGTLPAAAEARFCTDLAKGVTLNHVGRVDDAVRLLKACAVRPA
ncbi:MAG: hypothetical protein NTX87_18310 [Planctomycetota bacterium]|nr:hypothetical protein [Planctomycetota bacterium]